MRAKKDAGWMLHQAKMALHFEVSGLPVWVEANSVVRDTATGPSRHPYRAGHEESFRPLTIICEGQPDLPETQVMVNVVGHIPPGVMTSNPGDDHWAYATIRVVSDAPDPDNVYAPEDKPLVGLNGRGTAPIVTSGLDAASLAAPRRRWLDAHRQDTEQSAEVDPGVLHYDKAGNPL